MAVAVVRGILVCRHIVVGEVDNPLTAPILVGEISQVEANVFFAPGSDHVHVRSRTRNVWEHGHLVPQNAVPERTLQIAVA